MTNSAKQVTDEYLAQLVQQGDKEQFGVLVERYVQKLSRYGRKFLLSTENIEDLVQDTFLKAYQNMQSFDLKQRFSPWIYRIAHNTFINAIKKHTRYPILSSIHFDTLLPYLSYEDPSIRERDLRELKVVMEKSLDKLPSHYREIIVLYYFEEMDYKNIADILHIPTGTVGIRLQRAKKMLKKLLPKDAL